MPRFYFEIQTSCGVERDTSGVDVVDPMAALSDCLDAIQDVIASPDVDDLIGMTILDDQHDVIATINVKAIRRAMRSPAIVVHTGDETS
jgi:hypothetical protein